MIDPQNPDYSKYLAIMGLLTKYELDKDNPGEVAPMQNLAESILTVVRK